MSSDLSRLYEEFTAAYDALAELVDQEKQPPWTNECTSDQRPERNTATAKLKAAQERLAWAYHLYTAAATADNDLN